MTFKEAHAEVSVRYYLWSLREFRSEIESGFPLLKRLGTQPSKACFRLMQRLSSSDKKLFADALVKQFHQQGVAGFGHNIISGEMLVIQGFTNSLLATSTEDRAVLPLARVGDQGSKLNQRLFARLLNTCLSPLLGNTFEKPGAGELAIFKCTPISISVVGFTSCATLTILHSQDSICWSITLPFFHGLA